MDKTSTQKQSVDKVFDKNRNQPTQPQQPQREEGKPEQSPQQKQSKRYKLVRTTESVGNTFSAALKLQQYNTKTIEATSGSSIESSFTAASTAPSTETPTAAQAATDDAQRLKDGSTDVMGGGFAIPPPTASSAIAIIQQLQKQHSNLEAAIVLVAATATATATTETKTTNAKTVTASNKGTRTPTQMQEKLLDHIQTETDDDQKRDKNSKVNTTKKQDEISTAITSKPSSGRPISAAGKSKNSKESRGKFADKLRRSFRRGEHKSLEIKRPEHSLEGLTGGSISANHVAHRYSPQETNSSCNSLIDGSGGSHFNFGYFGLRTLPPLQRSSHSIFSLTHLPGLSGSSGGSGSIAIGSGSISSVYSTASGGHINPALLLDSPDADTPPEYAYHHLSSVATTNSSTSLESNFGEFAERTPSQSSISYWAWQQSNSSMGGEVSTSSRSGIAAASGSSGIIGCGSGNVSGDGGTAEAKNVSDWKGKPQHQKQKLQSQSSSKSDTQPQQASRSCSITSDSSSTKLTRLQNFLFKSSNESTKSFHAHSNEAFTASSHNSSSGEWENLGFTTTSGSGTHVAADFYVGSFPEESDDDNGVSTAPPPLTTNKNMSASGRPKLKRADSGEVAGSYYQYTLTSPNNPFLPEIIARTYHSAYEEEDEPLDDNVTAVKYGKSADSITTVAGGGASGTHSAQLPTPAYSRAGSQESTHSDSAIPIAVSASSCSPALHTSSAASSSSSTPGRQRRKLFILNSPTRHLLHQQSSHKHQQQQQQQQQSHAATDAAAVCKPTPSTFASGSSFIKSLNPFLPATNASASHKSDGIVTTSAATTTATTALSAVMGTATKRVPLKQSAVTSPIAVPQDLNAKREEFLRATMKICLVVSPPNSKLQVNATEAIITKVLNKIAYKLHAWSACSLRL